MSVKNKYGEDCRPTDEVIATALTKDVNRDGDDYWEPVWVLQNRLPQIFSEIEELARSDESKKRELAAAVLGENGLSEKVDSDRCIDCLLGMIHREKDKNVLADAIYAIGHHHDLRWLSDVVGFSGHEEMEVRLALTHSINYVETRLALETLVSLSSDEERDVRSWATFGLGSMSKSDMPEVLSALRARLSDQDDEVRGEALVGLARRGDPFVTDALLKELDLETCDLSLRALALLQDAIEAVRRVNSEHPNPEWNRVVDKAAARGMLGDEESA